VKTCQKLVLCCLPFASSLADVDIVTEAGAAMASPSGAAALTTWAEHCVQNRPGLPPPATRSAVAGGVESNPEGATRAMMATRIAQARTLSPQRTSMRWLAQKEEDVVCALSFVAEDGSAHEFAAHYRPDDARPLYLCASGYPPVAGADFEQARAALIERVLGGSTEGLRVSGGKAPIDFSSTKVFSRREEVKAPWTRAWLFSLMMLQRLNGNIPVATCFLPRIFPPLPFATNGRPCAWRQRAAIGPRPRRSMFLFHIRRWIMRPHPPRR